MREPLLIATDVLWTPGEGGRGRGKRTALGFLSVPDPGDSALLGSPWRSCTRGDSAAAGQRLDTSQGIFSTWESS